MYQHLYRRFLARHPGELHFCAHSHHYWPDVTREAMLRYWDDSASLVDGKWNHFFNDTYPCTQRQIATLLQLSDPAQLVFAPNTHEFVLRLLSCLPQPLPDRPLRVLTSDSEFFSFTRQLTRLAEEPGLELKRIASEPIASFAERICLAASSWPPDLLFVSQVFFNSGLALGEAELDTIATTISDTTLMVVDGYHGFCALPTDLSSLHKRVFYLAGGYKYAQAGEGICFLAVPPGCRLRPRNTGWFAQPGRAEEWPQTPVPYREGGGRFAGATFDLCALYRLNAVLALFARQGLDLSTIHDYVKGLQVRFLERLDHFDGKRLNQSNLLRVAGREHGHFFSFRVGSPQQASTTAKALLQRGVRVDVRGERLRFGFGLYHTLENIDQLFNRLDGGPF